MVVTTSSRQTRRRTKNAGTAIKTAVVGTAAVAMASASSADFSAFVAFPVPSTPTLPSKRWNVVTPPTKSSSYITLKKKKTKKTDDDLVLVEEDVIPTPPKKRTRGAATNNKTAVKNPPYSRTESFGAVTATTYKSHGAEADPDANPVEIHTLILGTHPSVQSLQKRQYFGHTMNAFWWIAGDCLGFRRDTGISKSTGKPYKFTSELRYGQDHILPTYTEQLHALTTKGFALWDIVQSCHRSSGSLDSDIRHDRPNPIRDFCHEHPSVRRIVLANGSSGLSFFKKHFGEWIEESGELQIVEGDDMGKSAVVVEGYDETSSSTTNHNSDGSTSSTTSSPSETDDEAEAATRTTTTTTTTRAPILVIPALAVSPAAAAYSYADKRDFWDQHVYQTGLRDYYNNRASES